MTRIFLSALALVAFTSIAQAACFADYKAKKDGPLRLHYGVVQLPDNACGDQGRAEAVVRDKVAQGGWTLLNVMTIFDESGLDQRKESAGQFFLRF